MTRRRTRYSFRANHDDSRRSPTIDVLAYSEEGAWQVLERNGYYNIERARKAVNTRPTRHRIDNRNVEEARDYLGLKWPVRIKQTNRVGAQMGCYNLRMVGGRPVHNITVKGYLDPGVAGQTLWHELTHAMQYERAAAEVGSPSEIGAHLRKTGERPRGQYRTSPLEREANANEPMNDACPLARSL